MIEYENSVHPTGTKPLLFTKLVQPNGTKVHLITNSMASNRTEAGILQNVVPFNGTEGKPYIIYAPPSGPKPPTYNPSGQKTLPSKILENLHRSRIQPSTLATTFPKKNLNILKVEALTFSQIMGSENRE